MLIEEKGAEFLSFYKPQTTRKANKKSSFTQKLNTNFDKKITPNFKKNVDGSLKINNLKNKLTKESLKNSYLHKNLFSNNLKNLKKK